MNDILKLSLLEVAQKIKDKEITSVELTRAALDRINEVKDLNNFITVAQDSALKAAALSDKKIANGEKLGLFEGVPIALKDNISMQDLPLTCASKTLANYVPPFDASIVTALKNEGAVILGKLNMDEFAMGSTNENSFYGRTKNFHNPDMITGGSSGGSANAVASYECFASLGSDTGGSIRQPAAYCGVVGLKPTYSNVSRYGVVAMASSFDQVGTLTRTVRDSAAMMNVISFYDKKDATSSNKKRENYLDFKADVQGKRLGIAKEFFSDALSSTVKARIMDVIKRLESKGAAVADANIKSFDAALATYYVLSCAEASSNLARFDGIKYGFKKDGKDLNEIYYNSRTEGFGDEVKRRIITGNYVLSSGYYDAYYLKASKVRTLIKNDFDEAFKHSDVLICPTVPTTAFKAGKKYADPAQVYLSDIYTVPANIVGLPAISVPCGVDESGLPIGVQIIGKPYSERQLFEVAATIEEFKF